MGRRQKDGIYQVQKKIMN